jgi:hypothetical protein
MVLQALLRPRVNTVRQYQRVVQVRSILWCLFWYFILLLLLLLGSLFLEQEQESVSTCHLCCWLLLRWVVY